MKNVALASSLASWPTAIDDMLEEEKTAGELVSFNVLSMMWAQASLVEAILFSDKLDDLLEQLVGCLDTSEC